jgi:UDP-glucose-4-epimerase GalE
MRILVTGGCGYIGSTTARHLRREGHEVVVVDDLSEGHRAAWDGAFHALDLRDAAALAAFAADAGDFDGLIHFAARAYVGESVEQPLRYWRANLVPVLHLCESFPGLPFVFSSTCATYGEPPEGQPLHEDLPLAPVNPYGATKAAAERLLADRAGAGQGSYAALRYFNAAGAEPDGSHGEAHDPENHLIPRAIQAAQGLNEGLTVFGSDWDTPDGTCVRDYIHVRDLARAHEAALKHLLAGGDSLAVNLGTGQGASVMEIIRMVEAVSGHAVPWAEGPRRPGDPSSLVADPRAAQATLGWDPVESELEELVRSAWNWHRTHPKGYPA